MKRSSTLFVSSALLFVALDQLVKLWVRHSLSQSQALPYPWPGVFEIELTYNQGIAFGMFQGKGVLLAPIAILIAAGSCWHIHKHPEETNWNAVGFGFLVAGAVGNLIDRVAFQRVTDMFWFRLVNFPVFNVADSCITIATIMLVLGWWAESSRGAPKGETPMVQVK